MPSWPDSTAPPPDLSRSSETARRWLYDTLKAQHFAPEVRNADSPSFLYSAEDADLRVFFFSGRWFALWQRLEVPSFEPEVKRVELLRITATTDNPLGIMLHEC